MNIITKIFIILISISMLSTVHCKPKEVVYKHTVIPDKIFGINFCSISVSDILKKLKEMNILYYCYDAFDSSFKKIECGENGQQAKIGLIRTKYFIGSLLDNNKIINIDYFLEPDDQYYNIIIKFKEDYYNTLLELFNKQLGAENANINFDKFNEIAWNTDPDMSVPTCITNITLSERLQYDDPAKAEKGVCYLVINTRARNPHVH